ncbi:unnamed protein product [Cylindrotheca closterium]|uniref:Guanylate cyclase domain-containing protein n=1 Tax=Cylindrotheca closterium TaxID=2856 RepID=A0AAD2GBM7_9STRA|nr:unnamed protein product [Cylindrotheca closterium]
MSLREIVRENSGHTTAEPKKLFKMPFDISMRGDAMSRSLRKSNTSKLPTPQDAAPIVAKEEEAAVEKAKILVAMVLFLSAVCVGVGMYMIGVEQDEQNFENLFAGYASEVSTVSQQKIDQLLRSLDSFAFSISSQAESELKLSNQRWPFYAVSEWSQKVEKFADSAASKDPHVMLAPVVQQTDRTEWANYMQDNIMTWVQESISNEDFDGQYTTGTIMNSTVPFIYELDAANGYQPTAIRHSGEALPIWQTYPLKSDPTVPYISAGLDSLSTAEIEDLYRVTKQVSGPAIGMTNITLESGVTVPASHIMQPIYDTTHNSGIAKEMTAVVVYRIDWSSYFEDLLVDAKGIILVLKSSCANRSSTIFSMKMDGSATTAILGDLSDLHSQSYDHLEHIETLIDPDIDESQVPDGVCVPRLTMHLYPTQEFYDSIETYVTPFEKASIIFAVFGLPAFVFFLYDYLVGRRQREFMDRIAIQEMIVSNVFPKAVRERIYGQNNPHQRESNLDGTAIESINSEREDVAPMAELFPSTTIVFADIAGFTAWASTREPQQVFILLETIFGAFDTMASQHGVFKVETVGDCYVGAAGLELGDMVPSADHASAACFFANDAVEKMGELTKRLEVTLGPDTADLDLRVGIHSGQVTAGVLRGERSRFQLFGDTMNTAARMESSGERNRIQLSQATVDLLTQSGHSHWFISRGNKIFLKGKGNMQTYWLRRSAVQRSKRYESSDEFSVLDEMDELDDDDAAAGRSTTDLKLENIADGMNKMERLVEWNVEVLTSLLQQIIASRRGEVKSIEPLANLEKTVGSGATILEEFVPIIPLKRFGERELRKRRPAHTIDIGEEAKSQLRSFLTIIAGLYKDNPFHNFEHASHVTASVKKLLKRIVTVDEGNGLSGSSNHSSSLDLVDLAGHSYGITSDPLTQFAVVFSAIIHDVDHPGVPNTQLVKEKTRSAQIYQKSIAEQNSVELSWDMLMGDEFRTLRACIYQTGDELKRFRQLVVNTVMATDVVDKELQELRKSRWEKAFSSECISIVDSSDDDDDDDNNNDDDNNDKSEDRKATIVIEHLIQASDVSHTMQHWYVYKTWNEKFFQECYGAYMAGRGETDPSINWYKGEIGFFEFYVIPLAKKLDSCGVFGVSSHEYLNYAIGNREEWVREGENLVQEWKEKYGGGEDEEDTEDVTVVC